MTSTTHEASVRRWLVPAVLLALLVALTGGLLLGRGTVDDVRAVDAAVDVGFARDMMVHHAQAVEMSEIVHRRSEDPAVNYLAFDILSTQQGQIGIMSGWLDLWGQPQRSVGAPMVWMGGGRDGPMPGMATDAQIAALQTLPPQEMTEQYLRMMIEHHRGALPMAAYATEHATSPDLANLAAAMRAGQASEIDLMQAMLAQRGFAPQPDSPSEHGQH